MNTFPFQSIQKLQKYQCRDQSITIGSVPRFGEDIQSISQRVFTDEVRKMMIIPVLLKYFRYETSQLGITYKGKILIK